MNNNFRQVLTDLVLLLDLQTGGGRDLCRAVGERWMLTAEEKFIAENCRRAKIEDLPEVLLLTPFNRLTHFYWHESMQLVCNNCPYYPYIRRTSLFCEFLLGAVDTFCNSRGLNGASRQWKQNRCFVKLDQVNNINVVTPEGWLQHKKTTEDLLKIMGDQFSGGVAVFDSRGKCLFVNNRGSQLFGLIDSNAALREFVNRYYQTKSPDLYIDNYVLEDGVQVLLARENIWDQMENYSVLAELAASMAHEVRNPLTVVDGYLQILSESNPNLYQYFQIMSQELTRANSILTEYLRLARNVDPEYGEVPVNKLLQEIYLLLEAQAVKDGKKIIFLPGDNLPVLYGDSSKLKQVFLNLGNNGIQACSKNGCLTIYSKFAGDQGKIIIGFIDTGPGVPTKIQKEIFSPFFSTKAGGTGLGLAVSRRIIASHRGEISVKNEISGGAHFQIFLPVQKE